jgi:hypothetical protein
MGLIYQNGQYPQAEAHALVTTVPAVYWLGAYSTLVCIPKEVRDNEHRVGMTRATVRELIDRGQCGAHRCLSVSQTSGPGL